MVFFLFFFFFGLHLKLNHDCCIKSLCPPCLQGDEIISLKIKLLTTNRWCVDTRPISEHTNSNRNKSGVSKKIVKPLLKRKLKTISRNQRKMNVDTIPLRKRCICYKANYMTRSLLIVLEINHLSHQHFIDLRFILCDSEGFNPINPNQQRLLRVSCILLSMYSTKSPWNLQLQEWR